MYKQFLAVFFFAFSICFLGYPQQKTVYIENERTEQISFNRSLSANDITSANDFIIELTIRNHDNIGGLVQLVETLPEGYVAEPVDTKGGIFRFNGRKVKITWMSFPTKNEFTIAYRVQSKEKTKAPENICGTMAYIFETKKKRVETKACKL